MTDLQITIRPERPGDEAAIHAVEMAAFAPFTASGSSVMEADLVDALRAHGKVLLSLVAEVDGRIVGHVLFSPVTIDAPGGQQVRPGLGPIGVLPEYQRQSIGGRLVREGLAQVAAMGHGCVLLVGHRDYYPRFGFRPARLFGLRYEAERVEDAFQVVELAPGGLIGLSGPVHFAPEFYPDSV